jgi:hypothetical protein
VGFQPSSVGFQGIALDTGADDILPTGWTASVTRDYVVKIQILALASFAAVLAGVLVTLEDVVACKLDFLLRQMVIDQQQNHPGHPDAKRDGADGFGMGFLFGEVLPFAEIKGLKRAVIPVEHNMGMALKQQRQRPAGSANIHRLPEAVEDQHVLVQHGIHIPIQLAPKYTKRLRVSTRPSPPKARGPIEISQIPLGILGGRQTGQGSAVFEKLIGSQARFNSC